MVAVKQRRRVWWAYFTHSNKLYVFEIQGCNSQILNIQDYFPTLNIMRMSSAHSYIIKVWSFSGRMTHTQCRWIIFKFGILPFLFISRYLNISLKNFRNHGKMFSHIQFFWIYWNTNIFKFVTWDIFFQIFPFPAVTNSQPPLLQFQNALGACFRKFRFGNLILTALNHLVKVYIAPPFCEHLFISTILHSSWHYE